jgi:hypothetical protein
LTATETIPVTARFLQAAFVPQAGFNSQPVDLASVKGKQAGRQAGRQAKV